MNLLGSWPSLPASPEVPLPAHRQLHPVAPQAQSRHRAPRHHLAPGPPRQAGLLQGHGKSPQLSGAGWVLCPLTQGTPRLIPKVLKRPHQKGPDTPTRLAPLLVALNEGHGRPGAQTGRSVHSARASPLGGNFRNRSSDPLGIPEPQAVSVLPGKDASAGTAQSLKPCPRREGALPGFPPREGPRPPAAAADPRRHGRPAGPALESRACARGAYRGGCARPEQGFSARLHRRLDGSPVRLPPSPDLRPLVHAEWVRQAPGVGVTRGARQGSPVGRTRRPRAPSPAARAPVLGVARKPRPATPPRPRLALVGPGRALC